MCLNEICRSVRSHVLDFRTFLWDDDGPYLGKDARAKLHLECRRLVAEIGRRSGMAARFQTDLIEFRHRLAKHKKMYAQLLKRIEIVHHVGDRANAWRHALQLEQLRQAIHYDRNRLQCQEKVYRDHVAGLERLKERLADLQDLLTV